MFCKTDSSTLGILLAFLPANWILFTKLEKIDLKWQPFHLRTRHSTHSYWSWNKVPGPSLPHMVLPVPPFLSSTWLCLNSSTSSWPPKRSKAVPSVLPEELMYSNAWHSPVQFQCCTPECQVVQVFSHYNYCKLLYPQPLSQAEGFSLLLSLLILN